MNEEEKKAIEKLKEYALCKVNDNGYVEVSANGYKHTILNLIENQQKELDNLKEIEKSHQEENGKLRVEFEKAYEDNLTLAYELEQEKEKNKELEKHQRQYLDGELITAKQGKFFEKMIKENYISKGKIKELLGNETIDISGFRCIAVEDIENLLEEK